MPEIAIVGEEALSKAEKINQVYIPGKVIMASRSGEEEYELLKGRYQEGQTLIYLCRNYTCQRPVSSI